MCRVVDADRPAVLVWSADDHVEELRDAAALRRPGEQEGGDRGGAEDHEGVLGRGLTGLVGAVSEAAHARGYRYVAITEHSKALAMANGLNEARTIAFAQRVAAMDQEALGIRVMSGIECDILKDGRMDLVVLTPYEKIKVLRQLAAPVEGRIFEELDVNPPGGATDAPWSATADVDGDGKQELLLAQRNFLRAVVLRPDPNSERDKAVFEVKDQINGASSSSHAARDISPRPSCRRPSACAG